MQCKVHGARYKPETGECVKGPCRGRKLVPLPLQVRGQDVMFLEAEFWAAEKVRAEEEKQRLAKVKEALERASATSAPLKQPPP